MRDIKISVVVPIYNVQDYLKKCIESIINQSYKNIEVILVDDGSTDNSFQICNYYAMTDNRIRVMHKENGGVTSARKAGTALATGDYILGVDGDDWIEENRIEYLVKNGIMLADADMIYMGGYKIDDGESSLLWMYDVTEKTYWGGEIEKKVLQLGCGVKEELLNTKIKYIMYSWAIRRELLQEKQQLIDDRIVMGEDIICIWFCLLSANNVTVIRQSGYHYVQRNSSARHNDCGNYIECLNVWYHQLKKYIEEQSAYLKETKQIFIYATIRYIIDMQYELLIRQSSDYLYPFSKVKRGSRIIVYGAGRMGYGLMKYLVNSEEYQVVLWVDSNVKKAELPKYKISPPADIGQADYDYIVIAVLYADVAREIKELLMLMSVPEEKIAWIDSDVLTEDAIPDEIKR